MEVMDPRRRLTCVPADCASVRSAQGLSELPLGHFELVPGLAHDDMNRSPRGPGHPAHEIGAWPRVRQAMAETKANQPCLLGMSLSDIGT